MASSGTRRVGRAGGCPTVGAGIVPPAGVDWVGTEGTGASTPDNHFAAGPHCRVGVAPIGRVGETRWGPCVGRIWGGAGSFGDHKNRITRAGDGWVVGVGGCDRLVSGATESRTEGACPISQRAISRQVGSVASAGASKMDYARIVRYGVIELIQGSDCDVKGQVLHHGPRCDHREMGNWTRCRRRRRRRCWLHFQGANVDAPIKDPEITALIREWWRSEVRIARIDRGAASQEVMSEGRAAIVLERAK